MAEGSLDDNSCSVARRLLGGIVMLLIFSIVLAVRFF